MAPVLPTVAVAVATLAAATLLQPAGAYCTCPDESDPCTLSSLVPVPPTSSCAAVDGLLSEDLLVADLGTLTGLDLSSLVRITGDLILERNTALAFADCSSVESVDGQLVIAESAALESVDFLSLATVGGDVVVRGNAALSDLALPAFVDGPQTPPQLELRVESNAALAMLSLPALVATTRALTIGSGTPDESRGNPALQTIDLSALATTEGLLFFGWNTALESLQLGALTTTTSYIIMTQLNALQTLSLPSLTTVGAHFVLSDFERMVTFEVPVLDTVGSYHSFLRLDALTTLSEPALVRVGSGLGAAGRSVQVGNCEMLARVDLPALVAASSDVWIRSGATGSAPLAINMSSFSSAANPGSNLCVQANGGEIGTCFEPPPATAAAMGRVQRQVDEAGPALGLGPNRSQ